MSYSSSRIEKLSENSRFLTFFLNLEASIQIILAFILLILGVLSYVPCPLKNP